MSKIDDALSEIKQYLSGNDHSDNPAIRQAAQVYSQACREINAKLADCRQLISRGLLIDAQKMNMEMHPSLSERAEKLILSPAIFNRYQELCRPYECYPNAPRWSSHPSSPDRASPGNPPAIEGDMRHRYVHSE